MISFPNPELTNDFDNCGFNVAPKPESVLYSLEAGCASVGVAREMASGTGEMWRSWSNLGFAREVFVRRMGAARRVRIGIGAVSLSDMMAVMTAAVVVVAGKRVMVVGGRDGERVAVVRG